LKIVENRDRAELNAQVRISKDYAKAKLKKTQVQLGDKSETAVLRLLLWLFPEFEFEATSQQWRIIFSFSVLTSQSAAEGEVRAS